jgi:hypothetical protein
MGYVSGYRNFAKGQTFERYAIAQGTRENAQAADDKVTFEVGYKAGRLPLALACRHLQLNNCGLNRYLEAAKNVIWELGEDGDIVRTAQDLDWVDEILTSKEQKS